MTTQAVRDAIIAAARAHGVNPAYALAVAQRESNFNPNARSSKTIRGIYQMRGDLRAKYGVGDSLDPGDQAAGWIRSLGDIKSQMRSVLGRDPTDEETYLGHHYGAVRAARTLRMNPDTPVSAIFTPQEMQGNPHFARAGTIGNLNETVMGDIGKRMARFGGDAGATPAPAEPADLSSFGTPVQVAGGGDAPSMPQAEPEQGPNYQANFDRNKKWSKTGNYRTDLGNQEPAFQKWVKDNKVPFDVNRTGPDDYDMRGFWQGSQNGDPRAVTTPNPNDGKIHYDDKWKTPYHKSFSSESQWAQPNAPTWNDKDQLIDPSNGGVVFDEKAPTQASPPTAPDLSSFGDPVDVPQPQPVEQPQPSAQAASAPPDLAQFGTPVS